MAVVVVRDDIDFDRYSRETEPRAKMLPAAAYFDTLKRRMRDGPSRHGQPMPWSKLEDQFRFRPGEVTLWLGENGDGKSLAQGFVSLGLVAQGQRVAICSFEMAPEVTLERMARQVTMGPQPTDAALDEFRDWSNGGLWLYDHQGQIKPPSMLAVCRYAAQELRIQHIAIDSMMKVVKREDDYNAQKDFVDDLCSLARDWKIHVHLVHHLKKPERTRGRQVGNRYDAKGSGAISDQVDNVLIWWRNREKEESLEAGDEVDEGMPDALLRVDKQRNGEWEGRLALYLHRGSMQFLTAPHARPIDFMGSLRPASKPAQLGLVGA